MGSTRMTQMGFYGQRVRQFLHLEHEQPSSITRSLRNAEIAVTETLNDAPVRGLSGRMGLEDDYLVSLNLTITRAASFGSAASVSPRPISERAQGTCMT